MEVRRFSRRRPSFFAPEKLRTEYESPIPDRSSGRLSNTHISDVTNGAPHRSIAENIRNICDLIGHILTPLTKRNEILRAMQEQLADLIWDGTFVAYGYALPRTSKSSPEEIPVDLFRDGNVDWDKSTVRSEGLQFESVRVLSRAWLRNFEPQKPAKILELKSESLPGRPSSGREILAAIDSLIREQKLPNSKSQKQNNEIVRARVHEMYPGRFPDDRRLSSKTIAKYLSAELRQLESKTEARNYKHLEVYSHPRPAYARYRVRSAYDRRQRL